MRNIKTKIGNHIFEMKNIDVYKRMSEETTAFCADVFIDGVCVGQCQNNGHGEGNYPYIGNQYRTLYECVENELSKYHFHEDDYDGRTLDWDYDMDFLIASMVWEAHYNNKKVYNL